MPMNIIYTLRFFVVLSLYVHTLSAQEQKVETKKDSIKQSINNAEKENADNVVRYMALDMHRRLGKVKRVRFYRGNELEFTLKGGRARYKGKILGVGENELFILGNSIPFANIDKIIVRNPSRFLYAGSLLLPVAGIGYFAMDMINPALDDSPGTRPFTVHREALFISGSLILSGIILHLLKKRVYRMNKRRMLRSLVQF
ncbi:hypothetical protein M23134_04445 [Microscilla marina ATCC 23134]|uniref:Uncharacterized protein n=2 Tax=Microscilla marina TaxID=1027 RepID=A1ZM66_MICM2|nr:hypothetical protein M23134_04445 [Microscilla marina ATCC 23134]